MNKDTKIPPAPTVYCPKDGELVPIWYCLGSLTQGREMCSSLIRATIHGGESAEVECMFLINWLQRLAFWVKQTWLLLRGKRHFV